MQEQELWIAVLGQAIEDATGRASYNRAEYRNGDPRLEAREWIMQAGPDFQAVCLAAGVDPDAVRSAVISGRSIGPLFLASSRPRRRTPKAQGRAA